jgi:hypothetical protein
VLEEEEPVPDSGQFAREVPAVSLQSVPVVAPLLEVAPGAVDELPASARLLLPLFEVSLPLEVELDVSVSVEPDPEVSRPPPIEEHPINPAHASIAASAMGVRLLIAAPR